MELAGILTVIALAVVADTVEAHGDGAIALNQVINL
jgi:hypothetical protein